MFPEIWVLRFWSLDVRFLAFNYSFAPGQSQELKFEIFRSGEQINPDLKIGINHQVPGTYEQLPGDY